jgi:hypothetical protein
MGCANQNERTSIETSHASHSFVFCIAVTPKSVIDKHTTSLDNYRKPTTPDFGVWVKDPKEGTFLVHGSESIMRLLPVS